MTHTACEMNIHELLRVAAGYDKEEIYLSSQQLDQLLHELHTRAASQLVAGAEMMFATVTLAKSADSATTITLKRKAFSHKRRANWMPPVPTCAPTPAPTAGVALSA